MSSCSLTMAERHCDRPFMRWVWEVRPQWHRWLPTDSRFPMPTSLSNTVILTCPTAPVPVAPRRQRACEQARTRLGDGETSFAVKIGADSGARSIPGQLQMMKHMALDERRLKKAATGAHFCEVRVDADTDEVRVTRWVASFDIGRVVNAKTAASQLRGGIVIGLGLALTEQTLIDSRTGRMMNAGLGDYHVPVHADVPRIEIDIPIPIRRCRWALSVPARFRSWVSAPRSRMQCAMRPAPGCLICRSRWTKCCHAAANQGRATCLDLVSSAAATG